MLGTGRQLGTFEIWCFTVISTCKMLRATAFCFILNTTCGLENPAKSMLSIWKTLYICDNETLATMRSGTETKRWS